MDLIIGAAIHNHPSTGSGLEECANILVIGLLNKVVDFVDMFVNGMME